MCVELLQRVASVATHRDGLQGVPVVLAQVHASTHSTLAGCACLCLRFNTQRIASCQPWR